MSFPRFLFLLSVAASLLSVLLTAITGTPGFAVTIALVLATGGVASLGIYFPWLEMYGRVLCRAPRGRSHVALTFDDGPHPVTTRRVLAALAPTHHRATFFVLGAKAERHPDVIREIRDAGHTLALHGYEHDRLHPFRSTGRITADLQRGLDAVERASGVRPTYFRPPVGQTSPTSVPAVKKLGLTLIGWSGRAYDGMRTRTPESALKTALAALEDGAVLVLHDAAEHDDFEPASLPILPNLLEQLDARGLTSVGLDALFPPSERAR